MLRLSRKYRNAVRDSVAGPHLAYDGKRSVFSSSQPIRTSVHYPSDEYCRKEHDEKCLPS